MVARTGNGTSLSKFTGVRLMLAESDVHDESRVTKMRPAANEVRE